MCIAAGSVVVSGINGIGDYGLTQYDIKTGGESCSFKLEVYPDGMTEVVAAGKLCVALSYE